MRRPPKSGPVDPSGSLERRTAEPAAAVDIWVKTYLAGAEICPVLSGIVSLLLTLMASKLWAVSKDVVWLETLMADLLLFIAEDSEKSGSVNCVEFCRVRQRLSVENKFHLLCLSPLSSSIL